MTITEGFICPECMKGFSRAELLEVHFMDHLNETKSKKLLGKLPNVFSASQGPSTTVLDHSFYRDAQSLDSGSPFVYFYLFIDLPNSNLTNEFRKHRQQYLSASNTKMNNLVIKLEQLMAFDAKSGLKRKDYEQTIVPWIGEEVKLCPSCGSRFGIGTQILEDDCEDISRGNARKSSMKILTNHVNRILDTDVIYRRKHHCRLCGFIMCADCSLMIDENEINLVLKQIQANSFEFTLRSEFENALYHSENKFSISDEPSDIISQGSADTDTSFKVTFSRKYGYLLRVCTYCKDLIVKKVRMSQKPPPDPPLVDLYRSLQEKISQVCEDLPLYLEMHQSIVQGESKFSLDIAKQIRLDLLQNMQAVDRFNREIDKLINEHNRIITNLPSTSQARPPQGQVSVKLMKTISLRTKRFIQVNLPSLRVLPTDEEFKTLVEKRRMEHAKKWDEADKQTALYERQALEKTRKGDIESMLDKFGLFLGEQRQERPTNSASTVSMGANWMPDSQSAVIKDFSKFGIEDMSQDPELVILLQQIELVAGYLDQAREAGRSEDDITGLRENLTELQKALAQRQATIS